MEPETRNIYQAFIRGTFHRCPQCGAKSIYKSYLKVKDHCDNCNLALKDYDAADAPPYIVMSLVGTLVVPLAILTDYLFDMSTMGILAIWLPLTVVMSLLLLPPVKGSVVGVLWALKMKHGGPST